MPTIGKISAEIFDQIILPQLGKRRPEVLVGPQHGVDVGVVDLGGGQVMVTTTTPASSEITRVTSPFMAVLLLGQYAPHFVSCWFSVAAGPRQGEPGGRGVR